MKIKEKLGSVLMKSSIWSGSLKLALAMLIVAGGFFVLGNQAHACSISFIYNPSQGGNISDNCSNPNGFNVFNTTYTNGQSMDWTSSISYSSGASGWLSMSMSSDSSGLGYNPSACTNGNPNNPNCPRDAVNLSVPNPPTSPGNYTASININAYAHGTANAAQSSPTVVTVTLQVSAPPQSPTMGTPTNGAPQNSCGQVTINWSAPGGGPQFTSYYLYRSTNSSSPYDSGSPWVDTGNTGTSYTYSASSTTPYYYWVGAHSSTTGLTSSLSSPSTAIESAVCGADFTNSNKIIYSVNGNGYQYSAPVNCGGSNPSGTVPRDYKGGDTVIWYVNLCNYGNIDSTSLTLNDTMTNITPSGANPYQISVNGGAFSAINPSGHVSCSNNVCQASFNLSGIKQSNTAVLKITTTLNPTTVQAISRFRNQASFIFSTSQPNNNLGCVGLGENSFNFACTVSDPGWIPYHGGTATTQQEVSP